MMIRGHLWAFVFFDMNDHEYSRMVMNHFIYDDSWTFVGIRVYKMGRML